MADWQTISALATAAGTLVLAIATFSAVRSSNRSARIAEQALLTGMRPLLVPSLADDPVHKVLWSDQHKVRIGGGRAHAEAAGDVIYMAMAVRNVGTGLALLHGWYVDPDGAFAVPSFPPLGVGGFTILAPGIGGDWQDAAVPFDGRLRVRRGATLRIGFRTVRGRSPSPSVSRPGPGNVRRLGGRPFRSGG